ncbi:hypothetical protein [Roseovarius ramblicola]|uniref:Uncharacterized protein n=1 Tax=Roseovarius ramblicola TaxID=2022336 RepID=A0ABV5HX06_9RHOB
MELIADILLVAGALAAGLYCHVLARRLSRFNDLESGVGGAVAVLSAQVDDLARTLQDAQAAAGAESRSLATLTGRAEAVAKRLELLVAAMHDLPEPPAPPEPPKTAGNGAAPVFRRHPPPGDGGTA